MQPLALRGGGGRGGGLTSNKWHEGWFCFYSEVGAQFLGVRLAFFSGTQNSIIEIYLGTVAQGFSLFVHMFHSNMQNI